MAVSSSRGFSRPRVWTCVSCTGRQILYHWAIWLALFYVYSSTFSRKLNRLPAASRWRLCFPCRCELERKTRLLDREELNSWDASSCWHREPVVTLFWMLFKTDAAWPPPSPWVSIQAFPRVAEFSKSCQGPLHRLSHLFFPLAGTSRRSGYDLHVFSWVWQQ